MKLEDPQFARENGASLILGYFADWQRNHETSAVIVTRSSDNLINCKKEPIQQLISYEKNKITEQEARAFDAEVVVETYKQHKWILREGLFFLLGEDPTTNHLSDAARDFAAPQFQYLEAQALKETVKEIVQAGVACETNLQKKHIWYQVGEAANTYLDYCRRDLFEWAKEVILPEVLQDLPEANRAGVTHLFEAIEQYPFLWDRHIDIVLRPRK